LARCRNNGVRQASGELIVFFDQDLVFSHGYLETLVNHSGPKRFVVGNPIRLDQQQNDLITDEMIARGDFSMVLSPSQKKMPRKQYRKELLYSALYRLGLRPMGPKLRGGIVGFYKSDFLRINGYDEKFTGWGNEDDDLGVRSYAAGIRGINPFKAVYAIHLHHERFHSDERVNKTYQKTRMKEIDPKNYRCRVGFEIHDSQDEVKVEIIK
jgi:hypothetical protein